MNRMEKALVYLNKIQGLRVSMGTVVQTGDLIRRIKIRTHDETIFIVDDNVRECFSDEIHIDKLESYMSIPLEDCALYVGSSTFGMSPAEKTKSFIRSIVCKYRLETGN